MADPLPRLRRLPLLGRLSLTCLVLVCLGGYAASGLHMAEHHGPRDGEEGLTATDVEGVYHGVQSPAPLTRALEAGHPGELEGHDALPDVERDALLAWLASDRIVEDWDNLDLGDLVPADLLDLSCLQCHSRAASAEVKAEPMLEYLDDVRAVAFARDISPTDEKILLASTHTHALALFCVTLLVCALMYGTRWPQLLKGGLTLAASAGLLLDLVSWWLARDNAAWVSGILAGGAAHAAGIGLMGLAVLADLWLPGGAGRAD